MGFQASYWTFGRIRVQWLPVGGDSLGTLAGAAAGSTLPFGALPRR